MSDLQRNYDFQTNVAMTMARAKQSNRAEGNRPVPSAPQEKAPAKGYTLDGKPRERAYRTYFGRTPAGLIKRYSSYEAREIDAKEGRITRITKAEATRLEEGPSPLVVSTQWSKDVLRPHEQPPKAPESRAAPRIDRADRRLIEARALLSSAVQLIVEIQARLTDLEQSQDDSEE